MIFFALLAYWWLGFVVTALAFFSYLTSNRSDPRKLSKPFFWLCVFAIWPLIVVLTPLGLLCAPKK